MKNILVTVFCVLLLLFSCDREESMPQLIGSTHRINIDLSGKFDDNKLRTLFFTGEGESEGVPKNKIMWNKVRDLQVALILKNQSNMYILKGQGQVDMDTLNVGNYNIHISAEYKSDKEMRIDDSYFISGILGGNINDSNSSLTMSVSNVLKKDLRELDIPVAFPWMRLKSENVNGSYVNVKDVMFNPIGNLIAFDITSEVYDPVNVVGLNVRTNAFSSGGYFDFSASVPKEGEYPLYKTSGNKQINYTLSSDNAEDLKIDRNQSVKYFYTWVMGNRTADKKYLSVGFNIKPVCRDAIISEEKNKIKTFTTPDFDRWQPKSIPDFVHGKPFFIKAKIQSTHLMITEVYHNTNKDNNEHLNIIELYNPSIYPIDISDYYLTRTTAGNAYYGWRNIKADFSHAWLYPVYIRSGHTAYTPDGMESEISDMRLDFATFYNSQITSKVEPGKTILLLADQYYKYLRGYYYLRDNKSRDLIIEDTNDKPHGPGAYVRNKCYNELKTVQFIVCSDDNTGYGDYRWRKPNEEYSHVLKFDSNMGFILYKKVDSQPYDKECENGGSGNINRFLAVDSYGPYFNTNFDNNPLSTYSGRFYVVRYDGVVFPSGGNYYTDQWKYIPNDSRTLENDITSIGARYVLWKSRLEIPEMPAGN